MIGDGGVGTFSMLAAVVENGRSSTGWLPEAMEGRGSESGGGKTGSDGVGGLGCSSGWIFKEE